MRSPPLLKDFPYYQHTTVVCGGGGLNKYQSSGADARPCSPRRPPYALLAYPNARRGGLRGAGGISTAPRMVANIERGFCPKNRSAAVVPSGRVRKKLCTAVKHARFLG